MENSISLGAYTIEPRTVDGVLLYAAPKFWIKEKAFWKAAGYG